MTKPTREPRVQPTPAERRPEVLRLLQLGQDHITRLLDAQRRGAVDLAGLFDARRGRRLVGAAWGQRMAGNSAFCWPPCLALDEPQRTAEALQRAVDRYLQTPPVALTQAVLPRPTGRTARMLIRAGYHHLTDMVYLACAPGDCPEPPPTPLRFRALQPGSRDRFARLVEGTYEGSLDCPQLDGKRTMEDVLAGYEATGTYRVEWWLSAWLGDQEVGCLILADHPGNDQCELVYLGVLPPFRGQGWGEQLTRQAQQLARRAGRQQLVLAVDHANSPARNVYSRTGFRLSSVRSVFAKFA